MDLDHAQRLAPELLRDAVDRLNQLHGTATLTGLCLSELAVDIAQADSDAINLGLDNHRRLLRQLHVPLVK